eukprot:104374_1
MANSEHNGDPPLIDFSTPLQSYEPKQDYFINMVPFRLRKKKCKQSDESGAQPLNLGLSFEPALKQAIEREQNTRRLTLDREHQKQIALRKKKQETRVFDIALLINSSGEYYKILVGPVVYEVFYGYMRFTNSQQYMHHDIETLNGCAVLVEELDAKQSIYEYFCNYSSDPNDRQNGVTFHFNDAFKCLLFRFVSEEDKHVWDAHKQTQSNTTCDVLLIANTHNIPMYVLIDVRMDLVEEQIQFSEIHDYQSGDHLTLQPIAHKLMDFELKQTYSFYKKHRFEYNFGCAIKSSFMCAICYNFTSHTAKDAFYHQSYDIALTTNCDDEFIYILSEIRYDFMLQKIDYASHQMYRNGDYCALKECAQEVKCIKIKSLQIEGCDVYRCVLFKLHSPDLWRQHIEKQCHFDVATITNTDDYLLYILSDVRVNWVERIIDFSACNTFKAKHHKIIEHYGELITNEKLNTFTLNAKGFKNESLNNIFFFQLKIKQTKKKKDKAKLKAVSTLLDLTQRDSIMPDRMSVLGKMQQVTKLKQKWEKNKQNNVNHTAQTTKAMKIHMSDAMNNVWNAYLAMYGSTPHNVQQLKSFSNIQKDIQTLSYFEARQLFHHYVQSE